MDKIIIGFSGKKGVGKNLAADLSKELFLAGKSIALADPIKEIAEKYFGIPREVCYAENSVKNTYETNWTWEDIPSNINHETNDGIFPNLSDKLLTKNKKYGRMTAREVLQYIGTELFRQNVHKDFWVKAMLNSITASNDNIFFITDIRFPNEMKAVQEVGGIIVRIFDSKEHTDAHESETALDPIDAALESSDPILDTVCEIEDDDGNISSVSIVYTRKEKSMELMYDVIIHNTIKDRSVLKEILRRLFLSYQETSKILPKDCFDHIDEEALKRVANSMGVEEK